MLPWNSKIIIIDLASCDFCLFPKIKSVLRGTHFVSVEYVKAKMADILNSLTEHDLRNCFEHWQHRMQLCVNSEENYFEGDRSLFPEFVKLLAPEFYIQILAHPVCNM
jgi:hypothetical protein